MKPKENFIYLKRYKWQDFYAIYKNGKMYVIHVPGNSLLRTFIIFDWVSYDDYWVNEFYDLIKSGDLIELGPAQPLWKIILTFGFCGWIKKDKLI